MGLFSILHHKLLCIPVFKEILHCKAVCDVKLRIDPLLLTSWSCVQITACFDNFACLSRQIKSKGKSGEPCLLLVGRLIIIVDKKIFDFSCTLKWYYDQKNNSFFSLDFKTMLTKH